MKRTNSSRRHSGGGPRPDLKELKHKEAVERQEAYTALSLADKIALLDRRLGKGQGAKKQRAKLGAVQ